MAIQYETAPVIGVQFHPESILTVSWEDHTEKFFGVNGLTCRTCISHKGETDDDT